MTRAVGFATTARDPVRSMQLYVNPVSPFCRAVAIYLDEKSVPCETVELHAGADRSRLLAVSPQGEVPALVWEQRTVAGSQLICDLADELAPDPPLVTIATAPRLDCRRLTEAACTTTDALQFLTHLVFFRRPEVEAEAPGLGARLTSEIDVHFELLDAALEGRPFFAGDYSRADVFLFAMVSSLGFVGRRVPPDRPELRDWLARMRSRPAIARDLERVARAGASQSASTDPFFRSDRIHWRSHRIEWACRLGLASWLAREIDQGRAFFSPPPRSASDL